MDQLKNKKSFENPVFCGDIETHQIVEQVVLNQKNSDAGQPISFFQLFRFASNFDMFLIVTSIICATASGVCFPMTIIYYGEIMNAFITEDFTDEEIIIMRCNGTNITDWSNSM